MELWASLVVPALVGSGVGGAAAAAAGRWPIPGPVLAPRSSLLSLSLSCKSTSDWKVAWCFAPSAGLSRALAALMDLDLNIDMPTLPSSSPLLAPSAAPAVKMKTMVPAVGRLDLIEKKRRLDSALGQTDGLAYWSAVERYLTGKISRAELYDIVLATLGIDNMELHNDFFLAILYNAQSTELPPSRRQLAGLSPSISSMEGTPAITAKASPSPMVEMGSISRNAIGATAGTSMSVTPISGQTKVARPSKKKKLELRLSPFTQRLAVPPFSSQPSTTPTPEPTDLPHLPMQHISISGANRDYLNTGTGPLSQFEVAKFTEVRETLQRRAREAGLKHVAEDAISALMFGLESHMQSILDQTVKCGLAARDLHTRMEDDDSEGRDGSIGVRNLLTAVLNNPGLVGDELPLIRERIMLHLY